MDRRTLAAITAAFRGGSTSINNICYSDANSKFSPIRNEPHLNSIIQSPLGFIWNVFPHCYKIFGVPPSMNQFYNTAAAHKMMLLRPVIPLSLLLPNKSGKNQDTTTKTFFCQSKSRCTNVSSATRRAAVGNRYVVEGSGFRRDTLDDSIMYCCKVASATTNITNALNTTQKGY